MNATACAIGSLPHTDPEAAIDLIVDRFAGIPFWPQLPKRDFLEGFYIQYSEGFPARVVDSQKQKIHFETESGLDQLADFYERFFAQEWESFALSRQYAAGFYALCDRLAGKKLPIVKGQVTGPVSFALFVEDHNERLLAYDPNFFDMVVKGITAKALWQHRRLSALADKVLIFLDEPGLVGIGSAFVQITEDQVRQALDFSVKTLQQAGAVVGIHCCANTDWSLVFGSGTDILSFDAVSFFDNLLLYKNDLQRFYDGGGQIAFGLIPTDDRVFSLTADTLLEKWIGQIDAIANLGIDRDRVIRQSLISPACGLGTSNEALAERALTQTGEVAQAFQAHFAL